ncbi:MAG: PQQ-dependent sugar dehydrogenase [Actinomycetota bacterium]|nr:PQQ-dependent sugar dehydrogenase [Actinomycetota bacterium]
MRRTHLGAMLVTPAVLLAACGGSSPATPSAGITTSTTATSGSSSTTASAPGTTAATGGADPCTVAKQSPPTGAIAADFATALAFAPDGRLFWAERSGTVRVLQDGAPRVFAQVSTVTTEPGGGYSERGLLGLAISPTFASDRYVYAFFSTSDRAHQQIVRWTDCAGQGTDVKVIVELPAGADCCHKGGRLAFGPDGKLYVTLGDQHTESAAQDTSDPRGKVLRYNPDGTVPADNPFGDPVWAFGFRNPFGLAIAPSGQVAVTGNGPTGDAGSPPTGYDVVVANAGRGAGYQWPVCYGYSHPIRAGAACPGAEPDWSSEATAIVPTGATFVNAAGPGGTAGKLVFCSLNAGMQIFSAGSPHATLTSDVAECRLDVKQGPDNALYYSDTTKIYRKG